MTQCWPELVMISCAACALTSKSAPLEMRYFAPPAPGHLDHVATGISQPPEPVRLGRVAASGLLGAKIVHRDSNVELAPYETLRWTDDPETYVRRALIRTLFEERSFAQTTDGGARTLDVEVVAFEEVRRGPRRYGRVELRYALRDDERVIARGTLVAEREASGPRIERVVEAIGGALDECAEKVASHVADAPAPTSDGARTANGS
jgi:cholesterol transport system auxiliary component